MTTDKDDYKKKCFDMFKRPDLLSYIKQEFDRDHFNDDQEKLFVFLSELSSQLPPQYRFSCALVGYSSEGKTNIWKVTSKHLPKNWFIDCTRITKASLEDDIQNVNLIYIGEEAANTGIVEAIKQLSEDGMSTLKKDIRKDNKEKRHEIQPRKTVIYSTTADSSDLELETRYCRVSITGNPQKYMLVNEMTKQVASNLDLSVDQLVRSDKETKTWINTGLAQLQAVDVVLIPYAPVLQVNSSQARSMRDFKRFCNLIRACAWLHQLQRVMFMYRGKTILVADPTDLYNAHVIGSEIFAQSYSGLEKRLQDVIDVYERIVLEHPEQLHTFKKRIKTDDGGYEEVLDTSRFPNLHWVDRSLIQKELGIKSRNTIKSHCITLQEKGIFTTSWVANRSYVAIRPVNVPVKDPLVTRQINSLYSSIDEYYPSILKNVLTGKMKVVDGSDYKEKLENKTMLLSLDEVDPSKKLKNIQMGLENDLLRRILEKIDGSELTGAKKDDNETTKNTMNDNKSLPPNLRVRNYLKEHGDDGKLSYDELTDVFPQQVIGDLIRSNLLVEDPKDFYRYNEVV